MSKYFKPDSAFGAEAECPICACLWTDPVEIEGCEHILCRACLQGVKHCPTCDHEITKLNTPNNAILRMLMRERGGCSQCPWKGTYKDFKENHATCLTTTVASPPSQASFAVAAESVQTEAERMQDYYMDDAAYQHSSIGHRGSNDATRAGGSTPFVAGGGDPLESSMGSGGGVSLSRMDAQRWRQGVSLTARDFGIDEADYSSLLDQFPNFATRGADGKPQLPWRGACRLLRYFNYPNHPDDVNNLFETARQSPSSGAVNFHTLCLWLSLNCRNPQQWYGMTERAYRQILRVAQLLDEDRRGLFTMDNAHFFAEQYFERDVGLDEWNHITRILRERDETIRQYFQQSGDYSAVRRDFTPVPGDIKLPFHDILVSFRNHVEALKRHETEMQMSTRRQELVNRIRNMIRYYNPGDMASLEKTISNFQGEEESLLQTLTATYGPEPS